MSIEPRATYRVQLNSDFTLDQAAELAGYWAELGISHLYCSPYLQAVPGSMHGYDVVNHHQVNKELGGEEGHSRLIAALNQARMGQLLDIVPNHMAINGAYNPWWWDVLENGQASRYASYFDVEWQPPEARHSNVVLVPVLGDQYGRVLEKGEIRVERQDGEFVVRYFDNVYPVDPRSLSSLLASAADRSGSNELAFLAGAFDRLPEATAADQPSAERRARDQVILREILAGLSARDAKVDAAIQSVIAELNRDFDALDVFLSLQNYRLAFWRMAGRELGYRRFFDINTLIGLRMEDERVFRDTHERVLDWLRRGWVDGLRIDHPDGLKDPDGYFERLCGAVPGAWVEVEKILSPNETLPETWPVSGTVGYDFLNRLNGLFVDPAGELLLSRFYIEFTGQSADFAVLAHAKKWQVMDEVLGSDVNRLTFLLMQVCERHRRARDYTRNELRTALCEIAACLPVYRTYIRADAGQVPVRDREYVDRAVSQAKQNQPDLDPLLFDFIGDLLLLRLPNGDLENELVMRFQQFTGPVTAKGVEDTAFYNYYRLVSLNEVGGNPGQFGVDLDEFHHACAYTQARWPKTLLATSTHDTKRSEDVRARINVLSEVPATWIRAVSDWSQNNARYCTDAGPDRNDEYLLYQTLVGAWPIEMERILRYMEKASREAKVHTYWTNPNSDYEEALASFVRGVLGDEAFIRTLNGFIEGVLPAGRTNALAQTVIKLTAPGIPDLYQGTEVWNLCLVDPDNRQSVDYAIRRKLLAKLSDDTPPEQVLSAMEQGLPKMWVIRQALQLRQRRPELFGEAANYQPLAEHSRHAIAFSRAGEIITLAPRFTAGMENGWEDEEIKLPAGLWCNLLTHEQIRGGLASLRSLLNRFPVALFEKI